MLITISEYAKLHGKSIKTIRQKCRNDEFQTARLIEYEWYIDGDEPYPNNRFNFGK